MFYNCVRLQGARQTYYRVATADNTSTTGVGGRGLRRGDEGGDDDATPKMTLRTTVFSFMTINVTCPVPPLPSPRWATLHCIAIIFAIDRTYSVDGSRGYRREEKGKGK